ncbi:MAG TPA: hypothetical protein VFI84_00590 [Candidatus Saccharimonadales bacterium]|nr:hypothetical protein [Candidatus Saccharimonadales bacterium]
MSNAWISLFAAAGVAAWAYSVLGRRVGYGNSQSVWMLVGAAFVFVFLFFITLLHYVIHLH